jgi:Fe-S-cluster containining protein
MKDINNNYQNTGCIKCGDCCEKFLMAEDLVNQHRSSFQRIIIQEQRFPKIGQILIHTIDGKCVFLFPDNTCSIYQDRPEFPCKIFGIPKYLECPKVSLDGKTRSKKEYDRIIAKNTDKSQWSDDYKKYLDEHSKKYVDEFLKKNRDVSK